MKWKAVRRLETETQDNTGFAGTSPNLMPPGGPTSRGPGLLQSMEPGPIILRVLVFLVLLIGFSATLGTLAAMARLFAPPTDFTRSLFSSEATRAIGTLLAAWVMSRLEGRRLGEYGLPWRTGQRKLFLQG